MNKEEEILKLREQLYLNFNDFHNSELVRIAERLVVLITSGNTSVKKKYTKVLGDCYKQLSEVEYLKRSYESCLNYIKKLQLCSIYKNETIGTIMHVTIRRFQCEVYMEIYQENFQKVEELKRKVLEFGENNILNIKGNLKEDYDELLDLATSFLNNSVKTIVNFRLPYKINIEENEEIIYNFRNTTFSLKFKTIHNQGEIPIEVNGGVVELDKDKYGIYSYSDLLLTFNKFFDATHHMDKLLNLCSEAFNYFLAYYKVTTDDYWIENLNFKQIGASNVRVVSENYDIISIPFYYPHEIRISTSLSYIDQQGLNDLRENLKEDKEIPLWKLLYFDSKNNILVEKYREAVISINSAFENYLNIKSRELLRANMTEQEVEDYLGGIPSYKTYFLNKFISREDFNKAVKAGVICASPPNTFQIINKCFEFNSGHINLSKRKVTKLVYSIRKNRNDIIHGNLKLLESIESDAKKSISSFEEFIRVFQ